MKYKLDKVMEKLNTLGKAISVIETISQAGRPLSIKDISDALALNKSSLHHHIKTLTEHGYLQQDPESRKYDIGLSLVRVGQTYLQRLNVRERGHYFLEILSKQLNETVHMFVLDNGEAVYVDKVDVNHQPGALKCSSFVGLRTDLYSTAAGKVLLSHQEPNLIEDTLSRIQLHPITEFTNTKLDVFKDDLVETKQRGYGLDLQEHALGLQCIAVPIFNLHSQCVAAISVSCPVVTVSKEILISDVLAHLRKTGIDISKAMGYIPTN